MVYRLSNFLKTALLKTMPGLYQFLEIKPRSATIFLTNRCVLRCIMCRQWQTKADNAELTTDEWKDVLKKLKKYGIKNINFTGGEPLMRSDLKALIAFSSGLDMRVGLTTNGYLLNKTLLEDILSAGLRFIAISMDSTEDDFDDIRGVRGSYAKAKEACELIAGYKQRGKVRGCINFVLMKRTLKTFKDVKRLADSLHLPVGICLLDKTSFPFDTESNRNDLWINDNCDKEFLHFLDELKRELVVDPSSLVTRYSALRYIADYFKDPLQKKIPCTVSQERIFIDSAGEMLGGCLSMGSFGNIKKEPLDKIISSGRYKKAKMNMFYKVCPGCSCGYTVNLDYHMPSMVKDIFVRILS